MTKYHFCGIFYFMSKLEIPHIVIARHGEFAKGQKTLNYVGVCQAEALASRLEARFNSMGIFSSNGPRSVQHANIVSSYLGTQATVLEALSPVKPDNPEECLPRAMEFLKGYEGECEAVCIITRGKVAAGLIRHIGTEVLNAEFGYTMLGRGEAKIIDTAKATLNPLYRP